MRYSVILAGGGGTRLWPASRRQRAKPLLPLGTGGETLLAATVRRAARVGEVLVVTAREQKADVASATLGSARILVEPVPKNTAAAVALAAINLSAHDPDAVMAVFPADHHVGDEESFDRVVEQAAATAEAKERPIVVIGVQPTRAETAFGYLELGAQRGATREVLRFVEKPPEAEAIEMARSGRHMWNAGIFIMRADRYLAELARHMPATHHAMAEIASAQAAGGVAAAAARAAEVYPSLVPVSIDHGVMEHAQGLVCVPGDFEWNDVGSWTSLADIAGPGDDDDNVARGDVVAIDSRRNIVAVDPGNMVALIGVDDLVVVQSGDAILVVPRARAQEVRDVIAALGRAGLERYT